jgi:tetratricopeptide (TPR) repeat protein
MDSEDIAHILDRANDLLEAGKPVETLRCLAQIEHALVEVEDRVEAATLRAWALSEMGQHEAALQAVEPLIDEYPDSSRLHAARGVVLSNADELEEAQEELEQALSLDADDEVTLANLALVCEKLRDYEQALELYERALNLGADIDWALQRKAAVHTELGDYPAARSTLRRYLSLAPDDATQWVALGILHSDDEEYARAIECYEAAERVEPDSAWLRLNWGVTAVRANDFAAARTQLGHLERCAPDSARPWLLRAFLNEEEGRAAEAEAAYQQALQRLDAADLDDLSYVIEMAIDFYARRQQRDTCEQLMKRAYLANACTVELCEAYREATGRYVDEATWYSLVIEADYRPNLEEVLDRELPRGVPPTRMLRNYQVVARDRDEATALVIEFARRMGEQNACVREFINDEPMEDAYLGLYEVERKSLVFAT